MRDKKHWACLADFKKYLEETGSEKVINFTGYELITNKARYGLAFGEISRKPHQPTRTRNNTL